ncbi:MAG: ferredoxin-type protein NapF [Dechloromonas sp.]|nr:ferredoxin-type protein NapF [Dechloromonas sp.]
MLSRRAFLGVARPSRGNPVRPPWALAESAFVDACTRCSACIEACPTGLLLRGDGGYPEADFTPGRAPDGCTLCGDCRTACTPGALKADETWSLKAVFSDACLAEQKVVCRTCGESCEARAIHFPPRLGGVAGPQLDALACTGCGACLADCPTRAIRILSLNTTANRGVA